VHADGATARGRTLVLEGRAMKVRSALVEPEGQRGLKAKYEEIYAQSDVWLYKKSHGVHSVILGQISELLDGIRVLDVGCGAGRLALMCATRARQVDGLDFSEAAVHIARLNAQACGMDNVSFFVADLDRHQSLHPYELVTLIGVLEHVKDPVASLIQINGFLVDGGVAVVSCPNFVNFRGHTYMTLLTLFDLPMSLADLRQVSYLDMQHWCQETGFELYKSVGAIYRFGWDEKAIEDMIKRVPLAVRDKGLDIDISINYESYNAWLRSQLDINRQYLGYLEAQGVLRRVQKVVEFHPEPVEGVAPDLWAKMCQYLDEDIESDPFYCEVEPFCYQGGEGIYLLRKVRDVNVR
jgi:2-polyprenyl-3-methyl-5-hydroxy-6-metoxy-1,4-benzoquinol methylase